MTTSFTNYARGLAAILVVLFAAPLAAQTNNAEFVLDSFNSNNQGPTSLPQAISALARKFDANLDWNDYALGYLETEKRQRLSSIMHDPKRVAEEVSKITKELRANTAQVKPNLKMRLIAPVRSVTPDGTLILESVLADGEYTIDTIQQKARSYILPAYTFLIANGQTTSKFKIKPALAAKMASAIASQTMPQLTLEVDMEVLEFKQHEFISSVVRKATLFAPNFADGASAGAPVSVIAENTEKADAKKMISKRMLSEGVTLSLVPDHGTTVDGYYMQEILIEDDADFVCKEAPRQNGHRVFLCERNHRNASEAGRRIVHRYVGGRRVAVELYFAEQNPPGVEAELAALAQQLGVMTGDKVNNSTVTKGCCISAIDVQSYRKDLNKPVYSVTSKGYLEMLAGKPGYEVRK